MEDVKKETHGVVHHLVVDSGGFIRNVNLQNLGENIYTIQDVVREIRDKATRARLQVLPYDLNFRNPSPESVKAVSEFAKKTGDYSSLSAVDLRVIALVYQLEKEFVGIEQIRTEPVNKVIWEETSQNFNNSAQLPGIYYGKQKQNLNESVASIENSCGQISLRDENDSAGEKVGPNHLAGDHAAEDVEKAKDQEDRVAKDQEETKDQEDRAAKDVEESKTTVEEIDVEVTNKECNDDDVDDDDDADDDGWKLKEGQVLTDEQINSSGGSGDEEEDSEEEDDDDDDGWITPGNIGAIKQAMGYKGCAAPLGDTVVACLTTDFAMQNVLIQMGLNVVSVDGMLIKRAQSYILRCRACFKVSKDTTRVFCKSCGNKTLQKLSMTVNDDGSIQYHMSSRKAPSTRGLRYSIPLPKGGKHNRDPILCEDQLGTTQMTSRSSRAKVNVFDPEYLVRESPFAVNDLSSRSAVLGIGKNRTNCFQNKRNPNENRKTYGRRK